MYNFVYVLESQTNDLPSHSTAKVVLGQALSIAICGSRTHTEVIACSYLPKLLTTKTTEELIDN